MLVRLAISVAAIALSACGAELAIENGTVAGHKPATLAMKLAAGAEKPTGFQFDLQFDAAALDLTVEAGPAAKQAEKEVQTWQLQPGKVRVLVTGFNRTAIGDGVLALIQVKDKGAKSGKSFPVHLAALLGTNADAKAVTVTAKDGKVALKK
jgi:hypothetical protein